MKNDGPLVKTCLITITITTILIFSLLLWNACGSPNIDEGIKQSAPKTPAEAKATTTAMLLNILYALLIIFPIILAIGGIVFATRKPHY